MKNLTMTGKLQVCISMRNLWIRRSWFFQDGEVESVHWVSLKVCREEILAGDSRYCVRPDEIQMISEALEQKKQC